MPDPVLSVAQVAEMFGSDPKTVARWANEGKIPHFRTPGGHHKFRASQIVPLLETEQQVIDVAHLERQRSFSLATFGPGSRVKGVLAHIAKEAEEVLALPEGERLPEWADLIILSFDGALRDGHEPAEIIAEVKRKQARNERRTWPDWRDSDQDHAIEHDRAKD